jgi:hypothetical protein
MTQFQKAIEKVLKAHNQLDRFQSGQDFYLRLDQPNYDRLVIERHGEIITVGHYFEQNGDLMADPEVELHYPDWTPVAITQLLVGRREKFIEYEGQTLVDKNFHRQVSPFLAMWGRNIDAQGWTTRATITSSRWSKE